VAFILSASIQTDIRPLVFIFAFVRDGLWT
jgi:hypothetical protein